MIAAVIPIKHLSQAKSRLAPALSQEMRKQLCLDTLCHMLSVLTRCSELNAVQVVTADPSLPDLLSHIFPQVSVFRDVGDLNQVAQSSAKRLTEDGFETMLFLLGDLPCLTLEDVSVALEASKEVSLLLFPDRHGKGTNGLALTPPSCLPTFSFGSDSLSHHVEIARHLGLSYHQLRRRGFAWDLDTPEDLADLATQIL